MMAAPSQRRIRANKPVKKLQKLRFWCNLRRGPYLLARVSNKGVPHLTAKIGDTTYSVAYFGNTKTFKVFWPHGPPYGRQEVRVYREVHEVGRWLMDRAEKAGARP